MLHRAAAVAHNLHLDMARAADELLHIQIAPAKGTQGFGAAALIGCGQVRRGHHRTHAPPATTRQRFEHHRPADLLHKVLGLRQAGGAVRALGHRHLLTLGQRARLGLVAKGLQRCRRGANKAQTGCRACLRKCGVLAQKTITGVDGIAAFLAGDLNQMRAIQISGCALGAQCAGVVGRAPVQAGCVVAGIDCNALDAPVCGRACNAHRNLPPVGDQYLVHGTPLSLQSRCAAQGARRLRARALRWSG